jgi:hypothetical protein
LSTQSNADVDVVCLSQMNPRQPWPPPAGAGEAQGGAEGYLGKVRVEWVLLHGILLHGEFFIECYLMEFYFMDCCFLEMLGTMHSQALVAMAPGSMDAQICAASPAQLLCNVSTVVDLAATNMLYGCYMRWFFKIAVARTIAPLQVWPSHDTQGCARDDLRKCRVTGVVWVARRKDKDSSMTPLVSF